MQIYLDPADLSQRMAADVRAGLTSMPKTLPPKYFYDAHGSELFDEITRLPEYYPTRAERSILLAHADEIARVSRAQTLIELGSGTSEKTRILLRALTAAGTLRTFVPFDVDPAVLEEASAAIGAEFADLGVEPIVGDFERHVDRLPAGPSRLVAFLGSTIGNLAPAERAGFLRSVRDILRPGDSFLVGTDLVKSPARLVAAYDDDAGVTARFNKNVLTVLDRELGAHFDLDSFEHVAIWNAQDEWIEMRLRSVRAQDVRIDGLDLDVSFAEGEEIRTEISAKFRIDRLREEFAESGLMLTQVWIDPAGEFALSLFTP